ncbi:TPA: alcohol dehydrogenase, partial [Candidatus Sumerlaeota bacterium]|nr:alcohol dehydrogenase [Candidatus Sumerlaeota bacterium]
LIPVAEDKSRSAICLVEPWACVEDSYATVERQTIKVGGKLLVVADAGYAITGLAESFSAEGKPASIAAITADSAQLLPLKSLGIPVETADLNVLPEKCFDDVVYFGVNPDTIEKLNPTLGNNAIINIVTAGQKIGRPVQIGVGRIHYGCTRWIGTLTGNAADSYGMIPASGEVRPNDNCLIIGAGGPMGQMHVIRVLCSGVAGLEVVATDFDGPRLDALKAMTQPLADANKVSLRMVNTKDAKLTEKFSYIAVMAPVSAVVAQAVVDASSNSIVNVFAGIPAPTLHPFDLNTIIEKRCFLFGTSGSTTRDMKIVLDKVQGNQLDTNLSVDAVSGMAGGGDGIGAVEKRTLSGKIIVYPQLHNLGLTPLATIAQALPTVAALLNNGKWTKAAEEELLKVVR